MRRYLAPVLFIALSFAALVRGATAANTLVYVGTYTGENKGKGIYLYELRGTALEPRGLAAETPSPSFLEIDLKRRLLFAVNEVDRFEDKKTGSVSAFRIDPTTGRLTLINQQPSMGTAPCHLVLDRTGRNLIVANYSSGSVAVIPVATDGRLGEPSCVIQHTGQGGTPRQKGPHAHCVTLDAANTFAFVCDLGLDKIMAYRLDAARGQLTPAEPAFAMLKPGSGPRHMAFRPDGKFAYVVNELNSTVTTFAYAAATGKLTEIRTDSTLPPGFDGKNTCAEVAVHPSGKWLYGSNRGRDSIAIFAIDAKKGTLTSVGDEATGGNQPRHFALDPSAKMLAVANQGSNSVFLRVIDPATGRLQPATSKTEVPWPVCVAFMGAADR